MRVHLLHKRRISRAVSFATSALLFILGMTAIATAQVEVPTTLTQQGRILLDSGEAAVGTYQAQFRLESGGAIVWMQTIDGITLESGFYSVVLGPGADDPYLSLEDVLTTHDDLSLGIEFFLQSNLQDPVFSFLPGQLLTSVPYSIASKLALESEMSEESRHAFRADVAVSLDCSSCLVAQHLQAGAVTRDALGAGSVTTGKLADGAVDRDKIADQSITPSKVLGGLYSQKEQVSFVEVGVSLSPGGVRSVSASCPNNNDLALFGECDINGLVYDVQLVKFGFTNVDTSSSAATYSCAFRSKETSATPTITARIYCIPSNN